MSGTRNADGTFPKGSSGNPTGRPAKARELAYLAILREVVTLEDWREVIEKALHDALHDKNWMAREKARRFLAEYAIGKAPQTIRLQDEADPFDQFDNLSDDELHAIVNAATRAPDPGAPKRKRR